jgi:hypothetical protein
MTSNAEYLLESLPPAAKLSLVLKEISLDMQDVARLRARIRNSDVYSRKKALSKKFDELEDIMEGEFDENRLDSRKKTNGKKKPDPAPGAWSVRRYKIENKQKTKQEKLINE